MARIVLCHRFYLHQSHARNGVAGIPCLLSRQLRRHTTSPPFPRSDGHGGRFTSEQGPYLAKMSHISTQIWTFLTTNITCALNRPHNQGRGTTSPPSPLLHKLGGGEHRRI
ncbi:hypothetical protein VPH35_115650 [Triticum aestivum]|uniref:Uncharacterized protein n=1 Tax=Aegilops tauschii subsp. strangulata TaxID=200361 RepID=A0A453N701_AEGTS